MDNYIKFDSQPNMDINWFSTYESQSLVTPPPTIGLGKLVFKGTQRSHFNLVNPELVNCQGFKHWRIFGKTNYGKIYSPCLLKLLLSRTNIIFSSFLFHF